MDGTAYIHFPPDWSEEEKLAHIQSMMAHGMGSDPIVHDEQGQRDKLTVATISSTCKSPA